MEHLTQLPFPASNFGTSQIPKALTASSEGHYELAGNSSGDNLKTITQVDSAAWSIFAASWSVVAATPRDDWIDGNETDDATLSSYQQSTWNSSNLSEPRTNRISGHAFLEPLITTKLLTLDATNIPSAELATTTCELDPVCMPTSRQTANMLIVLRGSSQSRLGYC